MRVCEGDVVGMAGITKLGKTRKGRRTAGADMILQWSPVASLWLVWARVKLAPTSLYFLGDQQINQC